ncbi:DUF2169 family type VI secretion system accessory protein [Piscinibacter gummiphilus]|uniref:DUF2169 domain-containing protein n=1 Tax=Piscinibacter gummiphilus TaxID=946333 RepID=A0A1W6L918_9BURK|nr:DUF2169 domain-containing protein [Piscinibacter gummiphilus]ARN20667.1 hypothetical protein A4W93_12600 [Piscinibacter gummiphilus]ATU65342.1 DUF2169 domain-containing protein [Piscinibacter gummiphilus]GLS94488.1 hypothetical protein GCM10007918_17800 [Piscinibacter gummiphilus]
MDEPILFNESGFHASVLPILDREGAHARFVGVKASWDIVPGVGLRPAEVPREIRLGDELWGAPEVADIRLPGDFYPAKPGTDFVLSGHAVPRPGQTDRFVNVAVGIADRVKVLRVHGPRVWERSRMSVVPGPSGPMVPVPLAWSRAYGGLDVTDPAKPLEDPLNPVGSGVAHQVDRLVGQPAPQIESPDEPVTAAGTRTTPAGCGAIGRHFEPRRLSAGTYDAAWLKSVYPARPADYREEHEHFAAPGLVFETPLRGGERVRAAGVHAGGALDFLLPKWLVLIEAQIDGQWLPQRPHLDTVVLDTDAMVLELVWRGLYRCPAKMRDRFTAVRVRAKEFLS